MPTPAQLSVNVNKVALLRNARGADFPNLLQFARDAVTAGAQGITVHPRPDGRHVRKDDVYVLGEACRHELDVEFNVEGFPSDDFLRLVLAVRPDQVTLVPDAPGALTSDAGWSAQRIAEVGLSAILAQLRAAGIRTSVFVDTLADNLHATHAAGPDRVELYTGPYAHDFHRSPEVAVAPYVAQAQLAQQLGLGLNAGHDLNLHNLRYFAERVPGLREVSIGHALVVDCLYMGLVETLRRYRNCLAA